jgi:hypothetical protein
LCGCVVLQKAKLPSETCPDPLPGQPHLNRWGEEIMDR